MRTTSAVAASGQMSTGMNGKPNIPSIRVRDANGATAKIRLPKLRPSKKARKGGKTAKKPDGTPYPSPTPEDLESGPKDYLAPVAFSDLPDVESDVDTSINVEQFYNKFLADRNGPDGPYRPLDLGPPYQRYDVWGRGKQAKFIQSLFNADMAVNAFWLCCKSTHKNCARWWALDCRQRCTAIIRFMAGDFKIRINILWPSGAKTYRMLSWDEIKTSPEYEGLKNNFLYHKLQVVTFKWLPLKGQSTIFGVLNSGVPINVDEQIYCTNYLARRVLGVAWESVFKKSGLAEVLIQSVQEEHRFAHFRAVHEVLMLVNGILFTRPDDEPIKAIALRKQERQQSAEAIHRRAEDLGLLFENSADERKQLPKAVLNDLKLTDRLDVLQVLASLLHSLFIEYPTLGRNQIREMNKKSANYGKVKTIGKFVHPRNVIDALGFLFAKLQAGEVTLNQLKVHRQDLKNMLHRYYEKKSDLSLNQSTSDVKVMEAKFDALEKEFKTFKRAF